MVDVKVCGAFLAQDCFVNAKFGDLSSALCGISVVLQYEFIIKQLGGLFKKALIAIARYGDIEIIVPGNEPFVPNCSK